MNIIFLSYSQFSPATVATSKPMSKHLPTNLAFLFSLLLLGDANAQGMQQPVNLYLIPGMGTDHRIFEDYAFDTAVVHVVPVCWAERGGAAPFVANLQLATPTHSNLPN